MCILELGTIHFVEFREWKIVSNFCGLFRMSELYLAKSKSSIYGHNTNQSKKNIFLRFTIIPNNVLRPYFDRNRMKKQQVLETKRKEP